MKCISENDLLVLHAISQQCELSYSRFCLFLSFSHSLPLPISFALFLSNFPHYPHWTCCTLMHLIWGAVSSAKWILTLIVINETAHLNQDSQFTLHCIINCALVNLLQIATKICFQRAVWNRLHSLFLTVNVTWTSYITEYLTDLTK